MDPYIAIAIFAAYFAADVLYCRFVIYVSDRRAVKAATCSASIALIMTLGIMRCVDNQLYLVPLCAGAWLGTYITVRPFEWIICP